MRKDFRGIWAGDGSVCRAPDEFLLIYERRTTYYPYRSSLQPDRECRILSVSGKYPEWRLRLSCRHPDPKYRLPKPFEVRQTLRMLDGGRRMIVDTEPVLGQPALTEDTFFCRMPGDPMPKMICFSAEKGHSVPCEP